MTTVHFEVLYREACAVNAKLRQTLTEAEASYQAEIAALTAERDRLRQERDSLAKSLDDAASHLADEEALRREMAAERDTLAAQLARAEPVLQAVAAYVKEYGEFLRMVRQHSTGKQPRPSRFMLIDAWDAYQATPATTERGVGE